MKTVEVFALAHYNQYRPEKPNIIWYPTLNSMLFVYGKKKKSLKHQVFKAFSVEVKDSPVDKPITTQVLKAYCTGKYREIRLEK